MLFMNRNPWGRINNNTRQRNYLSWSRVKSEHAYFTRPNLIRTNDPSYNLKSKGHPKTIYIFKSNYDFDFFKYMERTFTITTKNGSFKFNIDLLKDTSTLIKSNLESNPDILQYDLKCKDSNDIMPKIELLFLGQQITITEEENYEFIQIIHELDMSGSFLLSETDKHTQKSANWHNKAVLGLSAGAKSDYKGELKIIKKNVISYIIEKMPKDFIIATKSKEYKCIKVCVNSSKVISDFISKNPESNRFEYDFDDDCNEFQPISDFFNSNVVHLTTDNMRSLRMIAEDLEIEKVLDDIDDFINEYEKRVQTVDDLQSIIDSINELFETLYKIKEITVKTAKDKIVDSNWIQTEESVQELAAFILQAIRTDILLHPYLVDLIELLDKESDETNKIEILIPFLSKKLMHLFDDSKLISSFIFRMHQKGFITKDEILKKLRYLIYSSNKILNDSLFIFLPEIYEIMDCSVHKISARFTGSSFIRSYVPDKIDLLKKMRENCEPDDKITRALRSDDVDTLQSIISANHFDITKAVVPYNIFEDFIENGETNYINYSAAYGSLKCFKYLLLNHAELNDSSFLYAVFGGNIEIVKIVDQQISMTNSSSSSSSNKQYSAYYRPYESQLRYRDQANRNIPISEKIFPTIKKHQNDLFDWIFEQKYTNKTKELISNILLVAAKNGDCHPIASSIDLGYDFFIFDEKLCQQIIQNAARNGFYKLLDFITIVMKKRIDQSNNNSIFFDEQSSVHFGNLSIFQFYRDKLNEMRLNDPLVYSISHGYKNIIKYIFDNDKDRLNISASFAHKLLNECIKSLDGNNELFDYLIGQFKIMKGKILSNFTGYFIDLLSKTANLCNLEISKKIVNLILEHKKDDNNIDFSVPFYNAVASGSSEICQFLIDMNSQINFELVLLQIPKVACAKKEVLDIIIKNMPQNAKGILIACYLKQAICAKNKYLIEYLLKENAFCDDALFEAVETGDLEIVNMILGKNSKPSFINKILYNGTAINLAVSLAHVDIVKRLLTVPGIDLNLHELENSTPLVTAILDHNVEIFDAILEFYGPNIRSQAWQFNEGMKRFYINTPILFHQHKNEEYSEIIKIMNKIIDFDFVDVNSISLFSYFCQINEIEIIKKMIKMNKFDVNLCSEEGYTPLMLAATSKNVEMCKQLIECERTKINQKNNDDESALIIAVRNKLVEVIDALISNERFNSFESRLDYAFYLSDEEIALKLVSSENVDVNSYSLESGDSLLMTAIEKKYFEVVNFLIKCDKTKINHRDFHDETALIMSVRMELFDIVDILINDEKFDPFESRLDYAFYLSKNEMAKKLISVKNLDVNYQHIRSISTHDFKNNDKLEFVKYNVNEIIDTPLTSAVENSDFETVNLIIGHPTFDMHKSFVKEAIFAACRSENMPTDVFKKLIDLVGNDVNIVNGNGLSLLEIIINYNNHNQNLLKEILNSEKFDYKKCNFKKVFISYYQKKDLSSDILNELIDFISKNKNLIDFNCPLMNNQSFFTLINKNFDVKKTVEFLIENGADPNAPNKNGIYPLEYAINTSNSIYVESLINSGKIDYSIRFNETDSKKPNIFEKSQKTYLHLAARSETPKILSLFLTNKLMDINITDLKGETPLMEACRAQNVEGIHLLFSMDDLDYKKCNDKGRDALDIAKEARNIKKPETKEEYHQLIVSLIENNKSFLHKNFYAVDVDDEKARKGTGNKKSKNKGKNKGKLSNDEGNVNNSNDNENVNKEKEDKENESNNKDNENDSKENENKEKEVVRKEKDDKENENEANESCGDKKDDKENDSKQADNIENERKEKENFSKANGNEANESASSKIDAKADDSKETDNSENDSKEKEKSDNLQEKSIKKASLKTNNADTSKEVKSWSEKVEHNKENLSKSWRSQKLSNSKPTSSKQKRSQPDDFLTMEQKKLKHQNYSKVWTHAKNPEQNTKPSDGSSSSASAAQNKLNGDSHSTTPSLESSPNANSRMLDEIIAAIRSSIGEITDDQISQISLNLSSIAEKRAREISDSVLIENHTKKAADDVKQGNQFKFNEIQKSELKEAVDEVKQQNQFRFNERPIIEAKEEEDGDLRRFVSQKRSFESPQAESYNQNQLDFVDCSFYQNHINQQQWDMVMQMNNMRNVQFNMLMQEQEKMMKLLGKEAKNKKSSKKQSKKKKNRK